MKIVAMSRLLSLCVMVVMTVCGSVTSLASPYVNNNDGIEPRSGYVSLVKAPIELRLPEGFMFVDGDVSQEVLISWGNHPSTVTEVVGMIVSDTVVSADNIDKAWILTYKNIGHVQDNKAYNMGFNWILEGVRNSAKRGTYYYWSWAPKYDTEHHRLSLPMIKIKDNDTIVNHNDLIFGKTGLIEVTPLVSPADLAWLKDYDDIIISNIGFVAGERYEDFDTTMTPAYKSVSAFIKGYETRPDITDIEENGDKKSAVNVASFNLSFLSFMAKLAGSLVAIMLLLMLGVAITNKKDAGGKDVARLSVNVLLRICVFWCIYLLILAFGVFLVWLGIWLTLLIASQIFLVIALWAVIVGFLGAILKSLFLFTKAEDPTRVEISESEAPELFRLINEVAAESGEKSPKHVYVTIDVNAAVFYDKPILSLFFPGRKNLDVGLGFLYGLNRQELKAVIAHEYGHFGQGSMRVGKVVAICMNIITNLV